MPADWKRVEELFHSAAGLKAGERERWLAVQCGGDLTLQAEVLSLLESDARADGELARRLGGAADAYLQDRTPPLPRVGPYALRQEIGRGGMGTVHLAERDDGESPRLAAVKLVRRGMDTDFILERFRRERHVLARLHHPGIGRYLDGGVTPDGVPYLVMELVDGPPITRYCDERGLALRERLRLFVEVCAAVAHAHQQLVVHRDLKPGNILVDSSGRPKLVDFGICKLLYQDDADEPGACPMTPAYASPEQLSNGTATVASDVYSLGAVLYELVTGRRPHRLKGLTPRAMEAVVIHEDVLPPSSVTGGLPGDLDRLVLGALAKEPGHRPPTAEALGNDLEAYLGGAE